MGLASASAAEPTYEATAAAVFAAVDDGLYPVLTLDDDPSSLPEPEFVGRGGPRGTVVTLDDNGAGLGRKTSTYKGFGGLAFGDGQANSMC